jgi:hypothetical protein
MFKFGFLFVLTLLAGVASYSGSQLLVSSNSTSPVAVAISQIANNVFAKGSYGFDIVVHGTNTSKLEAIANDVGKSIQVPHLRRKKVDGLLQVNFPKRPAILMFNKWEEYQRNFVQTFLTTRYQSNPFFLIYIEDDQDSKYYFEDLKKSMSLMPRFFLDYFLEVTETSIILSTFERFQQPDCDNLYRVKVNEFSLATRKWESEKFVVDKFENLNQCEVLVNAIYPQRLAMQVDFDADNKPSYRGYVTKFNDIISKKMNFTFVFNPVRLYLTNDSKAEYGRENNNVSGIEYDVDSFRKLSRLEGGYIITVTKGFTKVDEVILVSRFKPYSMLEKVFLPFEAEVWWCLIGFLSGLAVIASVILVFASEQVRRFVFGLKVNSPLLNMM